MIYRKHFKQALSAVLVLYLLHAPQLWPNEWKRVYLATFPRSGNHWTRFIIEEATHIATSSVYPDWTPEYQHLRTPFPWGGYCCAYGYQGNCRYPTRDDIVVIKTHYPSLSKTAFDCAPHVKTIRIVRNPIDSFYSFYVFSHRGNPPEKMIPSSFVKKYIKSFSRFHDYYNSKAGVETFRYEDLLENPIPVFSQIFNNIGYFVREADIQRAVARYPPKGRLFKHIDRYQKRDIELIKSELGDFLEQFDYQIPN
ncbi:MAG: sulfotransferase domain-containing protein [Chlamydiales bacterium]